MQNVLNPRVVGDFLQASVDEIQKLNHGSTITSCTIDQIAYNFGFRITAMSQSRAHPVAAPYVCGRKLQQKKPLEKVLSLTAWRNLRPQSVRSFHKLMPFGMICDQSRIVFSLSFDFLWNDFQRLYVFSDVAFLT